MERIDVKKRGNSKELRFSDGGACFAVVTGSKVETLVQEKFHDLSNHVLI